MVISEASHVSNAVSQLSSQGDRSVSLPGSVVTVENGHSAATAIQGSHISISSSKLSSSISSSSSSSANPTAIVKPIQFQADPSKARQSKKPDDMRHKPRCDFLEK